MEANTIWAWPWWTVMVMINAVNLVVAAWIVRGSGDRRDDPNKTYRNRMLTMGLIFTLVGAYRSIFVSRYFSQMAWFDTILNSSLLIRSFAMTAELSFAGLFALAMLRLNAEYPAEDMESAGGFKRFFATQAPGFLVVAIFLAQFFAYGGLIFKSSTLFAIEESLWSLGFVSILPLAIMQWKRMKGVTDPSLQMLRGSSRLILSWCVIYCCYGLLYHLPLESWPYAFEQLRTGLPPIKMGWSAVKDALLIVHESKAYSDWGFGFLLWHSAYFSICVWIALYLMRAPRRVTT